MTAAPQKFKIDILPVDDGTPRIVTNLGLQWLEYMENKVQDHLFIYVSPNIQYIQFLLSFMVMFNSCKGSNDGPSDADLIF